MPRSFAPLSSSLSSSSNITGKLVVVSLLQAGAAKEGAAQVDGIQAKLSLLQLTYTTDICYFVSYINELYNSYIYK